MATEGNQVREASITCLGTTPVLPHLLPPGLGWSPPNSHFSYIYTSWTTQTPPFLQVSWPGQPSICHITWSRSPELSASSLGCCVPRPLYP